MSLKLQHFVYSLYPQQGYSIGAASLAINKQEWKDFCVPLPVELQDLTRLGRAWALQRAGGDVLISLFTPGAKDEFNRPGIFSHNIVIPAHEYLGADASPVSFASHFITDANTAGELSPLIVRAEDLQMRPDLELLERIRPTALKRTISLILKGDTFSLVCRQTDGEQVLRMVSALCWLLPSSARIVPFVTAPLGRAFRRERGQDRFKLKVIEERSFSPLTGEEYADIDKDYEPATATLEGKSAHYLVEALGREGYAGVKTLHSLWEAEKAKHPDPLSHAEAFVAAFEVLHGLVSLERIRQMHRKGDKQEAKRYSRAIVDERRWKSPQELAELFTILLENLSDLAESDVLLLISATENLAASERLSIFDNLLRNLPRMGDKLFARLRTHFGASFYAMDDLSMYPTISSRLLDVDNYSSLQSASIGVLRCRQSDLDAFERNLKYLLDSARKRFGEMILDFILGLIAAFPEHRQVIVNQVQKEDLVPVSVISHLRGEMRRRTLAHAEKVLRLLREIRVPKSP